MRRRPRAALALAALLVAAGAAAAVRAAPPPPPAAVSCPYTVTAARLLVGPAPPACAPRLAASHAAQCPCLLAMGAAAAASDGAQDRLDLLVVPVADWAAAEAAAAAGRSDAEVDRILDAAAEERHSVLGVHVQEQPGGGLLTYPAQGGGGAAAVLVDSDLTFVVVVRDVTGNGRCGTAAYTVLATVRPPAGGDVQVRDITVAQLGPPVVSMDDNIDMHYMVRYNVKGGVEACNGLDGGSSSEFAAAAYISGPGVDEPGGVSGADAGSGASADAGADATGKDGQGGSGQAGADGAGGSSAKGDSAAKNGDGTAAAGHARSRTGLLAAGLAGAAVVVFSVIGLFVVSVRRNAAAVAAGDNSDGADSSGGGGGDADADARDKMGDPRAQGPGLAPAARIVARLWARPPAARARALDARLHAMEGASSDVSAFAPRSASLDSVSLTDGSSDGGGEEGGGRGGGCGTVWPAARSASDLSSGASSHSAPSTRRTASVGSGAGAAPRRDPWWHALVGRGRAGRSSVAPASSASSLGPVSGVSDFSPASFGSFGGGRPAGGASGSGRASGRASGSGDRSGSGSRHGSGGGDRSGSGSGSGGGRSSPGGTVEYPSGGTIGRPSGGFRQAGWLLPKLPAWPMRATHGPS